MKILKVSLLSSIFVFFFVMTVNASNYWHYTNYNYAYNVHDGILEDKYVGTVSVKGSDRLVSGQYVYANTKSAMTYNVQGTVTNLSISATSVNDSVQRKQSKTVRDIWNFGPKTTVNYKFTPVVVQKNGVIITPTSIEIESSIK